MGTAAAPAAEVGAMVGAFLVCVCGEALTARGRMRWGMQRAACGMRL